MTRWSRARATLLVALCVPLLGCPQRSYVWVRPASTKDHLVLDLGRRRGRAESLELWTLDVTECRSGGASVWRLAVDRELLRPIGERAMWSGERGMRTRWESVRYGAAPPGYAVDGAARPLQPGYCYLVRTEADGGGWTAFVVERDGRIRELDPDAVSALFGAHRTGVTLADGSLRRYTPFELDSAKRRWRAPQVADSLASARCHVAYAAARTGADTTNVDRRVNYDSTADGMLTFSASPARGLTCRFICTKIGPGAGPEERNRRTRCDPAPARRERGPRIGLRFPSILQESSS